jgi:GT2 family glycosyltransferase
MIKLSVIIPNWNGEKYLDGCLKSLCHQSEDEIEIIVVDNGSSDDSERIVAGYPKVRYIPLKKNLGFAKAANIGIKEAKASLIGLLNNDTEIDSDWAKEMTLAANRYPDAGFFASKMLQFNQRNTIDAFGDALNWSGRAYNIGKHKHDSKEFSDYTYTFGACAGAAVYRKEMFENVGYFDEDFFMYLEDVDLSFRAQNAGHRCVAVPKANVFHVGGASSSKNFGFIFKYINKNRWHMMYKNYPTSRFTIHLPEIIISELRFFAAAVLRGYLPEYFWAVRQYSKEHPKMKNKRRKIQRSRQVSLKYLDRIIN